MPDVWETIIGLEVHCELATATKLFCGCPNRFGDEPNTNVCPVCLGLPGSLPVPNEQVVELPMRLGRALHCTVRRSVFARKNYFYPDMPKDYQISQYDLPINVDGWLELPSGPRVGIERAHIEEDTGKSIHVGGGGRITEAGYSLVDYNRAGVPLLEIVSAPDLRSSDDARAYETDGRTHTLRVKEEAEDYRYFPEPDLVPLDPGDEWVGRNDAAMPALPADRRAALSGAARAAGAAAGDGAVAMAVERGLDGLALEAIAAGADPVRVLTHVEHNLAVEGAQALDPAKLAALVAMETSGELTPTQAKAVLAELVATGEDPAAIAKAKGYEAMGADALGVAVDAVIAANAEQWARFVDGDDKVRGRLTGFFVGQVMKATKGQADGKAVTALLRERAGI